MLSVEYIAVAQSDGGRYDGKAVKYTSKGCAVGGCGESPSTTGDSGLVPLENCL